MGTQVRYKRLLATARPLFAANTIIVITEEEYRVAVVVVVVVIVAKSLTDDIVDVMATFIFLKVLVVVYFRRSLCDVIFSDDTKK